MPRTKRQPSAGERNGEGIANEARLYVSVRVSFRVPVSEVLRRKPAKGIVDVLHDAGVGILIDDQTARRMERKDVNQLPASALNDAGNLISDVDSLDPR